jgi:hypothetical protein
MQQFINAYEVKLALHGKTMMMPRHLSDAAR